MVLLFLLLLLLLLLLIYLYLRLLHQTTKIAYVGSENFIWNRIYSELLASKLDARIRLSEK